MTLQVYGLSTEVVASLRSGFVEESVHLCRSCLWSSIDIVKAQERASAELLGFVFRVHGDRAMQAGPSVRVSL